MTRDTRAQRLVDEFEENAIVVDGRSTRHGIAAVLRHIADTESNWESETAGLSPCFLHRLADTLVALPPQLSKADLPPDAQAVLDAFTSSKFADIYSLVAALRIAATQIMYPEDLLSIAADLVGWANALPIPEAKP